MNFEIIIVTTAHVQEQHANNSFIATAEEMEKELVELYHMTRACLFGMGGMGGASEVKDICT